MDPETTVCEPNPAYYFCKQSFTGTQPHPLAYKLPWAASLWHCYMWPCYMYTPT